MNQFRNHANLGWDSVCNLGSAERGAEPEAWNETRNDWNKIGWALAWGVINTTQRITVYSVQPEGLIVHCVPLSEAGGCPIAQVEGVFTENWVVHSGFT
ncbi:hypothetical protein [Paenibacillus xylanexedens]|uniref:hypothetical protein n=1 Tax=Paenibacillus xylanexedens TaxID=528191 RepID=UPI0011A2BD71|nr:hypothetical protein [Paenibacillus xylanexedens]